MFRAVHRRASTTPGSLRATLRVPCSSSVSTIIIEKTVCGKPFPEKTLPWRTRGFRSFPRRPHLCTIRADFLHFDTSSN